MNFNKVIIAGRLTRAPEMKYSSGGNAFCAWGMAVNRYYNKNGERQQEVFASLTDAKGLRCFVDVKAFGRQAEIVGEYVQKGNPLFVEGRLSFYQYETESGERRNKLSVIAERVQLMGQGISAPPDNMEGAEVKADGKVEQPPPEQSEVEDDVPF